MTELFLKFLNDNTRRAKVAKELENFGNRVQYSVFEAIVDEEKFCEMKKNLLKYINEEDSIRFYRLCESCVKRVSIIGTGKITKDEDFYVI